MRIRDWSSDVCSSDLESIEVLRREQRELITLLGHRPPADTDGVISALNALETILNLSALSDERVSLSDALRWQRRVKGLARKSVVKGQSVSVRVDLGGRRMIQKKKKQ